MSGGLQLQGSYTWGKSNVQFRPKFFNILNHANFAVLVTPNPSDIFDFAGTQTEVAGLRSSTTSAREIQFALKLVW
jgi:hypothetical protein